MKMIVVLALYMLFTLSTAAQQVIEKQIPPAVESSVSRLHPGISGIVWEKVDGYYQAEFKRKGTEYSVLVTAEGELIESEIEISPKHLPASIKRYIRAKYKGKSTKEASKITDANGTVTYEAEVDGADLLFDRVGKLLKVKQEDEELDED
jgi:hypothetical protein